MSKLSFDLISYNEFVQLYSETIAQNKIMLYYVSGFYHQPSQTYYSFDRLCDYQKYINFLTIHPSKLVGYRDHDGPVWTRSDIESIVNQHVADVSVQVTKPVDVFWFHENPTEFITYDEFKSSLYDVDEDDKTPIYEIAYDQFNIFSFLRLKDHKRIAFKSKDDYTNYWVWLMNRFTYVCELSVDSLKVSFADDLVTTIVYAMMDQSAQTHDHPPETTEDIIDPENEIDLTSDEADVESDHNGSVDYDIMLDYMGNPVRGVVTFNGFLDLYYYNKIKDTGMDRNGFIRTNHEYYGFCNAREHKRYLKWLKQNNAGALLIDYQQIRGQSNHHKKKKPNIFQRYRIQFLIISILCDILAILMIYVIWLLTSGS